ncbi:hypothetical protein V6Z11_D09G279800 [Gossypium hirsutum]
MDSSMKISFNRCIRDGDLIIVNERHDTMKAVKVCENLILQNRVGVFKHSDWVGKPFGSITFSNKGGFVYLLALAPELWTLVLSHRTQILYIADISFVIMYLEVVPGCLVLESGTKRTGISALVTAGVRDIQGEGFPIIFLLKHHELLLVICTNIWTFEMLLHLYEIREWKMDHLKVNDGNSTACPPRKRRQPSSEASVGDNASSPTVMAWPSVET